MIRAVLLDFGETLVERISDRDAPLTRLTPVLFPETRAVLRELDRAGYRLAVVSNTDRTDEEAMNHVLTRLGIRRHIATAVTSVSVGARKPEPEIFLRALGRLQCSAPEAVMVGDDAGVDIAGGAALGMTTILVRRDQTDAPESGADFVVRSLSDVVRVLDRLRAGATGS